MLNHNNIIVFDFETGGTDPDYHEAIEIAGKAYAPRTLEPYPASDGGEFRSLMKPLHFDRLEEKAMSINGISIDELKEAPDQKIVWKQFVEWVNRWNTGKNEFTAPIPGGKNLRAFDLRFVEALNKLHLPKKAAANLFHKRLLLDLDDIMFWWFENESDPKKHNMDTLRDFFGLPKEGAHGALVDTQQTGELIMRFLKLHRDLQKRLGKNGDKLIKFKGCCANG